MSDDHGLEVVALGREITDVRQDEINARQVRTREGNATVHHDPLALLRRSIAVEGEVHTDFAHAAERQKYQFFLVCHFFFYSIL
ncbi:Uncharacterised protein [Mycobacterium tuberculosis]|nr:Uncharacterised protein [Mycobacterium tuberculosis]